MIRLSGPVGGSMFCILLGSVSTASVIHVDGTASAQHNGQTWATAFDSLTDALAVAVPGDEIWVAAGSYHPGSINEIEASFVVPSQVSLYGGFSGTETYRWERNWQANETRLSGDLAEDDAYGNPWYSSISVGNNSKSIVKLLNASNVQIDGFQILGGNAVQTSGGGISATDSTFEIRNCKFTRNLGYQGMGACVAVFNGSITVNNCLFTENWGRYVSGAGIGTAGTASAKVFGSSFIDNHSQSDSSLGEGAGLSLMGSGASVVWNSRFVSNTSYPFFSSYPSYGGGIYNSSAPLSVDLCLFEDNGSMLGGGIFSWKSLTVSNCLFRGNEVIAGGSGGGLGGGIAIYFYGQDILKVVGCTFVDNRAHETAGIHYNGFAPPTTDISGCIFWGNTDINGTVSQSSVKKASYSCIQNLWTTIPGEDPIDPAKFPNCIDSNPQFVAFPTDARLTLTSPCIDAANKLKFEQRWFLDLDQLYRFMDVPTVANTGSGTGPLPDMGCFEAASGLHPSLSEIWTKPR